MAAIVSTLVFAGCADDVYDPDRGIHTTPKENPLGQDFTAPDDFNWSMINTVNLNVGVNDEFNGQYQYLVEVFTSNPIADATATPVAVGVANKNGGYSAEINVSKVTTRLFIRQTDPKQRKEVYEFEVPENGGTLDCKLYYIPTTTRAASRATGNSTSAFEAAKAAGIMEIEDKEYKEADIPSVPTSSDDFVQYNPGLLKEGAKYIIGREYTQTNPYTRTDLRVEGGRATVFVEGVWKLGEWASLYSSLNIYVMNGGKIIGGNLTIGADNTLTIQKGGTLESTNLSLGCPTKNFGTISVSQDFTMNLGQKPELFNDGIIKAEKNITINGSNVINHHILAADNFFFIDAQVLNKAYIDCATNININGGKIFNYGDITFDESDGKLTTNNTTETALVNHYEATIKGYEIEGGVSVYNDGFIETSKFKNSSSDVLYNSCTVIVKKEFKFRNVTLNKGSITGGRTNSTDKEWLPVPEVETLNDAKFTLIDGSMIKAKDFDVESGNVIFQASNSTNTDKSMIKAEKIEIDEPTHVQFLGNLVVEGKIECKNNHPLAKNESVNTGYDESKYTIETCGGIFNEGEQGGEPGNPEFPVEIGDSDTYTFAFEDNWPVYGDFDLNDLIIVMSQKKLQVEKSGLVTRLKMVLELRATGATKTLSAGIRFTKFPKNIQLSKFTISGSDASFEDGQSAPTCILFYDARTELWGDSDVKKCINTITSDNGGLFKKDTKEYSIIMEIPASANVKPEDLNINNIDIFAITAPATTKGKRTEVHVAGFAPTDLGGTHYFTSGNDDSSVSGNRYYLSKENLAWAVVIPQEFAWPQEYKKVTNVYDKFQSWITTGGQQNKDWYKFHNEDVYPIEKLTPLNKK